MTEMEVSETRSFKGMRWVARIISLIPGALILVFFLTLSIQMYFATGPQLIAWWGFLLFGIILGLPPLLIGLLAWKRPRAGGIVLIVMSVVISIGLGLALDSNQVEPIFYSCPGTAFLGGILHLIVSPWGHRLWYRGK